jgi:hypothetical protein
MRPTELTASSRAKTHNATIALDRLTIVLVGDTGFNPTDAKVDARACAGQAGDELHRDLAGIACDVDGDLAFINPETVVTDRNAPAPETRARAFRSEATRR